MPPEIRYPIPPDLDRALAAVVGLPRDVAAEDVLVALRVVVQIGLSIAYAQGGIDALAVVVPK